MGNKPITFNINGHNTIMGTERAFIANAVSVNAYGRYSKKSKEKVFVGRVSRIAYDLDYTVPREDGDKYIFYVDLSISGDQIDGMEKNFPRHVDQHIYTFNNVREDDIFPNAEMAAAELERRNAAKVEDVAG